MSYMNSPCCLHLRQSKQAYAIAGRAYRAGNRSLAARATALSKKLRKIAGAEYRLWRSAQLVKRQTNQLRRRLGTTASKRRNWAW